MSIAEDVETQARELGCWGRTATAAGFVLFKVANGYELRDRREVSTTLGWKIGPAVATLTAPEAALWLRCVASGLEVELPCSDCEERGGSHEWARWTRSSAQVCEAITETLVRDGWAVESGWIGPGGALLPFEIRASRPCPTCSEPACSRCGGSGNEGDAVYHEEDTASLVHDPAGPCVKCEGKRPGPGVPTGRETVGLAAAWMRGRPTPCERRFSTIGYALAFARDIAEEDFTYRRGSLVRWTEPGDPSTREALGVLADKRQSEGDPLGELLALDLAGAACPACKGTGKTKLGRELDVYFARLVEEKTPMNPDSLDRVTFGVQRLVDEHGDGSTIAVDEDIENRSYAIDGIDRGQKCPVCEGHGTALAQRQRAIGTAAHPAASLTAAACA